MRTLLPAFALALASCAAPPSDSEPSGNVSRWTDPETGCVYLFYSTSWPEPTVVSLAPRLRRDGTHDCPESPSRQSQSQGVPLE